MEAGQEVVVKVIKKDMEHKKIGLSIAKAAKEKEKAEYSAYLNSNPELTQDLSEQLDTLK